MMSMMMFRVMVRAAERGGSGQVHRGPAISLCLLLK